MEFRGATTCPICEERCHDSQLKEVVRARVPERRTIEVCVDCYDEWRTSPEYEDLRPDYSVQEAREIDRKREFYAENRLWF